MATPKVIKNFSLTVQGYGFLGLVTNVTLPTLSIVTDDHRAGGMDMPIKLDMGMEALEMSFEIVEQSPLILGQFGLNNQNAVTLIFRAAMQDDVTTVPYFIVARGMVTSVDMGSVATGDKNNMTVTLGIRYLKIVQNNLQVPIIEIDADNMIRKINGVDELQAERDAIGGSSLQVFNNIANFL